MNVAEVLRRAKDEIDTRGWCKRTPLDDEGRVCAIGALWFASGGSEDYWDRENSYSIQDYIHSIIREDPVAQYLSSYLVTSDGGVGVYNTTSRIWEWNDDAASAEEVKDGLEAAARQWERENR